MRLSDDLNKTPTDHKSLWITLFKAEALTHIVWAIVIGAVAITAIIVYGGK